MELQVQKDLVPTGLDLAHNGGAFRIVQLHADFDEGFAALKFVQKSEYLLCAGKVAGHDNILTHLMCASYNIR